MSVRMKITHSKTASRRAHHRALIPRLVSTAGGVRRRHFADLVTGTYRGKQLTITKGSGKAKVSKKSAKEKKEVA